MKRLNILILILTAYLAINGCTPQQQIDEPLNDLKSQKFSHALDLNMEIEKKEVQNHYKLLGTSTRNETSLSEYHRDLSNRYNKVVSLLSQKFQLLDPTENPETQMNDHREVLMDEYNVPLWYQELRQSHVNRIVQVNME